MRILAQSEVTPELTQWARYVLHNELLYPMCSKTVGVFDDRKYVAIVEIHPPDFQVDRPHRGVTLFALETTDTLPVPGSAPPQAIGVDLSHYQRGADLARVAAVGYSFAIAKACEGLTGTDDAFDEHLSRASDAGVLRGAYHFYRASSPPIAQVRRFVELVGDRSDLPMALDFEWQSATSPLGGLSPPEYADAIAQAVHDLGQLTGRKPIVYTAAGWWSLVAGHVDPQVYREAELWVAAYTSKPEPTMPPGWPAWRIWQHADKAIVPGIPGLSDVNRFAGTVDELRAWARGTPPDATDAGRILEIAQGVDEGREGLDDGSPG